LERLRQLMGVLDVAAAGSDSGGDTESEGDPDSDDGSETGSATAAAEGNNVLPRASFRRVAPAKDREVELLSRLAFQLVMARELRAVAKLLSQQQAPLGAAVG
jgi:hypothetical protein